MIVTILTILIDYAWTAVATIYVQLAPPTHNHRREIKQLRAAVTKLRLRKPARTQTALETWHTNLYILGQEILTRDPRTFLTWSVIKNTMFAGHSPGIATELATLSEAGWLSKARESQVGLPTPYPFCWSSSSNTLHLTYHLLQLKKKLQTPIESFQVVVEFGGGYGNLCRLANHHGFQGVYIIYDFPLLSALQYFYLTLNGFSVSQSVEKSAPIYCLSDWRSVDTILKRSQKADRRLFVGTWSLSEAPLADRLKAWPSLKKCTHFLIAFQRTFGEVDNLQYFKQLKSRLHLKKGHISPITHLSGSYYLFAQKD